MIEGIIVDPDSAVIVNAKVTLSGPRVLGGPRTVTTDGAGHYAFRELLPGTYTVEATAPGFRAARQADVLLPVETTYSVTLQLPIAGVTEALEVRARHTLIDVHSSAIPTIVAEPMLHDLPTDRTLRSLLSLAPGVTTTSPLFGYVGEVSFGGTQGSNGFTLDGVNLTESSLGDQSAEPHYNWLEEAQVTGLGAPAEYGGSTGATINGVLRSGSNRLAGMGELLTIRPSWTADNLAGYPSPQDKPIPPKKILSWWDANAQLGGPIVRDRLFAFGGFSERHHEYRQYGFEGPAATDERTSRTIVKLDASANRNLWFQGFVSRDASDIIGASVSQYNPTPESSPDNFTRTYTWNVRATAMLSPTTVLEARSSGNRGSARSEPHGPATLDGPSPSSDFDTGVACCNSTWDDGIRSSMLGTMTLAHHHDARAGRHDLKAGIEFERAPVRQVSGIPTGRRLYTRNGAVAMVEEWAGDDMQSTARRTAIYFQDRWVIGDRLTLEPGLRAEFNNGSVPGVTASYRNTPIAPRIGVAWDVTGAQRTVVRAHYGRYHDPLYGGVYKYTQPHAHSPHVLYEMVDGRPVELFRYIEEFALPAPAALKQSHVDQWIAGVERAIGSNTTIQGQYIGRRFGHFIGWIDNRLADWTRITVQDPGPDGEAGNTDDGGMVTVYQVYGSGNDVSDRDLSLGNPDGAYRRYDGLQLMITRRFAQNLQYQASYTWSRSRGNTGNEYHTNATYSDMNPFGYGADPTLQAAPPAPPVYDYSEFKAIGSYRVPVWGGLTTGAVLRWHNGIRWNRYATVYAPTWTRFAAEPVGSRTTPSLGSLDLRMEKTFRLPHDGRLGLYVDIFNATNLGRAMAYDPNSGPSFGTVRDWTDPRTGRLGVRYSF